MHPAPVCSTFAASAWARNLGAPVRDFLRAETGGTVVLVGAALFALAWANAPWPRSYEAFWTTELALSLNDHVPSTDLRGFVNEGLMTLFFLVVGLEAQRELDLGECQELALDTSNFTRVLPPS